MSNLYYLTIDHGNGEPKEVHGPYENYIEAYKAGQKLGAEGGIVESHAEIPICDFCSSPDIHWRYEANNFLEVTTMWGSAGDWAACNECHALIEADDRTGLTNRSVDTYFTNYPGMLPDTKETRAHLFREISMLHAAFFKARTTSEARVEKKENPHARS